jgi:hypothetical protein
MTWPHSINDIDFETFSMIGKQMEIEQNYAVFNQMPEPQYMGAKKESKRSCLSNNSSSVPDPIWMENTINS